jgi:Mrp family chromosome partitioning ATPase
VLKSQAMQQTLQALGATGADVVVLAAPPVTGSADSGALAALADGVIVVIDQSHARRDRLLLLKRSLAEAGARILGCVVCHETLNSSSSVEQPEAVADAPLPPGART